MRLGMIISAAMWAAFIAAFFMLSGCAEWSAVKSSVASHGAKAADEELITARWATCDAATAGALRRRYSGDPAGLKAWQDFCSNRFEKAVTP